MRPDRTRTPWLGRLAIAALALALSLVVGETVVRVLRPQELSLNHSAWDPDVGFINQPGIEARTRTAEFDMRVKINSRGLRDREFSFAKPPDTVRIGIFGDSFTFGHGVAAEETYPKVLERLANGREPGGGPAVEVLNFGIGKTGTSHQLAWYLKEGRRYDLDALVLGFLAFNDFANNWEGVYYLEGDRLVHTTTAYNRIRKAQSVANRLPLYALLATHSHLFNLAKRAAARVDDRWRGEKASARNSAAIVELGAREEAEYRLTLRLVTEFRSRVEGDGASFFFLGLPARGQQPAASYTGGEPVPAKVALYERLLADLAAGGFEVLDLVPLFSALPVEPYYFTDNGHMRARGHAEVARSLLGVLAPAIAAGPPATDAGRES